MLSTDPLIIFNVAIHLRLSPEYYNFSYTMAAEEQTDVLEKAAKPRVCLPSGIKPSHYDLQLVANLTPDVFTFTGKVSIQVMCLFFSFSKIGNFQKL